MSDTAVSVLFSCAQATISRRHAILLPVIEQVTDGFFPTEQEIEAEAPVNQVLSDADHRQKECPAKEANIAPSCVIDNRHASSSRLVKHIYGRYLENMR